MFIYIYIYIYSLFPTGYSLIPIGCIAANLRDHQQQARGAGGLIYLPLGSLILKLWLGNFPKLEGISLVLYIKHPGRRCLWGGNRANMFLNPFE